MHRTVIQDREVSQDIASARKKFRMVDEAIQAIEWTLSRNPDLGIHRSSEYWLYNQQGFKVHQIPEIVVLYSFTDDEVTFHAIVFRAAG
jgi:hypothetical protein